MPRLALQPDNDRIWVTLDEQRLVSLRDGDCEGLKVITTWMVGSQTISVEEAAAVQGVKVRTIEAHLAIHAEAGYIADVMDRRYY